MSTINTQEQVTVADTLNSRKRILFPTDFSETADNAFRYALQFAEQMGAELIVLHVSYETPIHPGLVPLEFIEALRKEHVEEAQNYFEVYKNQALARVGTNVPVQAVLKFGHSINEIVSFSEDSCCDMILMGTQGAESMAEKIAGSITAKVIEHAKCPVLVIPTDAEYRPIHHMVYAMNLEKADIQMIDQLLSLNEQLKSRLSCLHVRTHQEEWDGLAFEVLQKLYQYEADDTLVSFYLSSHKDVFAGLTKFLAQHNVDMIAMLTHKRLFLEEFANESMTRKMALHTDTPLLVLHDA